MFGWGYGWDRPHRRGHWRQPRRRHSYDGGGPHVEEYFGPEPGILPHEIESPGGTIEDGGGPGRGESGRRRHRGDGGRYEGDGGYDDYFGDDWGYGGYGGGGYDDAYEYGGGGRRRRYYDDDW